MLVAVMRIRTIHSLISRLEIRKNVSNERKTVIKLKKSTLAQAVSGRVSTASTHARTAHGSARRMLFSLIVHKEFLKVVYKTPPVRSVACLLATKQPNSTESGVFTATASYYTVVRV